MKLEKGLYAYLWQNQYDNNCNTFVIDEGMTILIDPGHSRHLPNVFRQMNEDGISPEEIDVVIVTTAIQIILKVSRRFLTNLSR